MAGLGWALGASRDALLFVCLVFVSLLRLSSGSGRPAEVKDIELLVLRHQLDGCGEQHGFSEVDEVVAFDGQRDALIGSLGSLEFEVAELLKLVERGLDTRVVAVSMDC
jgi:hypothetical protein